jgi:hypothetical protein
MKEITQLHEAVNMHGSQLCNGIKGQAVQYGLS